MERPRSKRSDVYVAIIEARRDELSDDELELLLALHENASAEDAAMALGISVEELEARREAMFALASDERLTKRGELRKKRLSAAAYVGILVELGDAMTESDRAIIQAIAESRNQGIAAKAVGMSYPQIIREHTRIRRTYDF